MITVNGRPVLSGLVSLPYSGTWYADVDVSAYGDPIEGAVMLEDGETEALSGTVTAGGITGGRYHLHIVGGLNKLSQPLACRHYRGTTAAKVLRDIASDAGEPIADPVTLTASLPFWSRAAGTGGEALQDLSAITGKPWRVRGDGRLWMGDPLRRPVQARELDADQGDQSTLYAAAAFTIRPGDLVNDIEAGRVEYQVTPDDIRVNAWQP